MNTKLLVTAAASAALALAMGINAMAADIATTTIGAATSGFKTSGVTFADRNARRGVKDMIVEPGTDPASVELHFAGAQRVEVGPAGAIRIIKADGAIWNYKPEVYQMVNGKRKYVLVSFHFIGKDRVSLRPDKYDSSAPLVIGPVDGRNGNS